MSDWKEFGGCVTDDPTDKTWITKPSLDMAYFMGSICGGCDVRDECRKNADEFEVSGVFQAGEWRE